ncbi:MAG: flippase-like domain-containing protein, partial [bacterium]|nr:flippase-like domain-containing protein [Candidatus Kapabacteria bacterium]
AFVVAAVWYGMARVDWPALWDAIASANAMWIFAAVVATLASHLIRAHRWRLLIADGMRIPLRAAFSATIIGYMFNNIIPRSGELARPWVLARRESRPLSAMIASIVVERIIDGVTLAVIVVVLAVTGREIVERLLPEYTAVGLIAAITIPVVALVVAIVLAVRTTLGESFLNLIGRWIPAKVIARLRIVLADFKAGAHVGNARSGSMVAVYAVLIWLGYALGVYFGFLAFGFDMTYGLGAQAALMVLGITSIGITIAPTPGAFLVYHSFCIAVLTVVFGVPDEPATAFALVSHGAPYIAVTTLGAVYALLENVGFGTMMRAGRPPGMAPKDQRTEGPKDL